MRKLAAKSRLKYPLKSHREKGDKSRGEIAASFHTFFAVRIEYCSNHSPKQILKNKYPIVGLQSHMLIGFVDSTVSLQMKF